MPASASVLSVNSFVDTWPTRRPGIEDIGTIISRQPQPRRNRAGLDPGVDLGRPAGGEVDEGAADGGLLLEQPGAQQRLADVLRERALVARETAREMREVGVV